MEQNLHGPEVYDFRQYDRIWQRVAPGLEPYPEEGEAVPAARTEETALMQRGRQESQLPGAQTDPCCMGSAAAEMLEVLTGFERAVKEGGYLELTTTYEREAPMPQGLPHGVLD